MNLKSIFTTCLTIPFFSLAVAEETGSIDAGGGTSSIGPLKNHSSIGGIYASNAVNVGTLTMSTGLVSVIYAGPFDADMNGLSDAWEKANFGHTGIDPQGDDDADGDSNLIESLVGTDPKDNSSKFNSVGAHNGATFSLPIQTLANRNYQVSVSKDLKTWHPQPIIIGDGSQKIFTFDETSIAPGSPLYSSTSPSKYFFSVKITIPTAP